MGAWRDDNGQGLKCAFSWGLQDGVGGPVKPLLIQELSAHDSVGLEGYFDLERSYFGSFWVILSAAGGL